MEKQTELFGGTDIDMLPSFVECLDKLPDIKSELKELRNILWDNPSYGSHISGGIHKTECLLVPKILVKVLD